MTPTPQTRRLRTLEVSALGLGCMPMTTSYGMPSRSEQQGAQATINRALDLGLNFLDTADMYAAGGNERLVGRAIAGRRDETVLATKFGIRTVPVLGLPRGLDGRPERARGCLDASLRRLGTDHIDLYYLHRVDPSVPIEDTVGAMAELVRAGKVRELGLSEVDGEQLRRAHAVHPIAAVQSEWSIFSRDLETEVLPTARELGVGLVAYSPLGRGMLTGSPAATTSLSLFDYRRFLPRWRKQNLATNLAVVDRVRELAAEVGCTPAQLVLGWLLAQGEDVIPIPGTTKSRHLESNLAAATLELPAEVLAELSTLRARGDRYGTGPGAPGRRPA